MARSTYGPRVAYIGTGVLASYAFLFKIENKNHIYVSVADATGTLLWEARGDDTTRITDVVFDAENGGGTVILNAVLPSGQLINIAEANELPTQPYEFKNKSDFTLKRIEMALDFVVGPIQRLMWLIKRVPTFSPFDNLIGKSLTLPKAVNGAVIGWSQDGTYLRYYTADQLASSGSGNLSLPLPTDGKFGGPGSGATGTAGSVSGVDVGSTVSDAFDKVEVILEKLAPPKPANLSAVPLTIAGSYNALESSTGVSHLAIDNASPVVATSTTFYDGDSGTLTANLDTVAVGSRVLTTASDVGTYTQLAITEDSDPFLGVAGREGFWKQLRAQLNAAGLALGMHTAQLVHTATGSRSLVFYVDDPGTPTVTGITITPNSIVTSTVSGVPWYSDTSTFTVAFTAGNSVRTHYRSTLADFTSSHFAPGSFSPSTPPANGANVAVSIPTNLQGNVFTTAAQITARAYNSKGTAASQGLTTNIRIDTTNVVLPRVKSGTGQYPTKGTGAGQWGDVLTGTELLSANKELQKYGPSMVYPPLVNYSSTLPAGPDYSGLTPDSYANMRWVTVNLGAKTAVSSVTITFGNAQNFGGSTIVSGLALYVFVDGAAPTTGWVDGNAAYPGVGSPTANGDAALDVAQSSATVKRVTFGTTPKTGTVYVRVGIPSGSNKSFDTMTIA